MKLRDIAEVDSDSEVTGFAIDHRKVAKGSVFGAFRGAVFNGEDFVPEAVRRGAVAVIARPQTEVTQVPHLADPQPRRLFAELAARFYAPYPDTVVAVTGTNGKTSTVEMTRQIWRMSGHRSASIGTLGVTTSDDQVKTGLTTPDIVTFLNNMAGLERMGTSHVAYEASSHGLDQHRCEGVPLAAAAFTNFSRDHLDYHETMESYFEAKMRLFEELLPPGKPAVIWTDDPKSEEVMDRAAARGHKLLTVGRKGETIRLVDQSATPLGQALLLEHEDRSLKLSLPLIGAYQAANVLVAAGLAMATGLGFDRAFDVREPVAVGRHHFRNAVADDKFCTRQGKPRLLVRDRERGVLDKIIEHLGREFHRGRFELGYFGKLFSVHAGQAKVCLAAFHRHPFVVFFFEMHIARVKSTHNVEKLFGLNAHRTRLFDLGLGVAADRHVEVRSDNSDLVFADRFDQDVREDRDRRLALDDALYEI